MRILVIGGAGFLGTQLVSELSKTKSNQIQVFDTFSYGFPKDPKRKKNVEAPVCGSITNFRDLARLMERFRPDVVFHLAAFTSRPESYVDFRLCAEVNYLGTANVIYAITSLRTPPKKLIFASTLAAENPQSHFGISKRAAEDLLLSSLGRFAVHDVELNILRFAEIYGPSAVYTSKSMANFLVDQMLMDTNLRLYGVQEKVDCLHITDAVRACILAAAKKTGHVRMDIGTGQGVVLLDLINRIKELTEHKGFLQFEDSKVVPVKTYIADTAKAAGVLDFQATVELEPALVELVKKRRKVIA